MENPILSLTALLTALTLTLQPCCGIDHSSSSPVDISGRVRPVVPIIQPSSSISFPLQSQQPRSNTVGTGHGGVSGLPRAGGLHQFAWSLLIFDGVLRQNWIIPRQSMVTVAVALNLVQMVEMQVVVDLAAWLRAWVTLFRVPIVNWNALLGSWRCILTGHRSLIEWWMGRACLRKWFLRFAHHKGIGGGGRWRLRQVRLDSLAFFFLCWLGKLDPAREVQWHNAGEFGYADEASKWVRAHQSRNWDLGFGLGLVRKLVCIILLALVLRARKRYR
ncbi:hypothetical protein RchiOBHm_Chr4g0409811 [Rosa chinensis]|uniref:Uncharacterized protein n=1 Tax=Rosa chinensis TaxID=74649 RepID=A0A2P6QVA3_ROSCH|nr:hypothetical protein RchiOBHm_Chr4g0409811 [Rosa chinensis]